MIFSLFEIFANAILLVTIMTGFILFIGCLNMILWGKARTEQHTSINNSLITTTEVTDDN